MRTVASIPFVLGLALSLPALAGELARLDWKTTAPLAGTIVDDVESKDAVLALGNDSGAPATLTFARIESPGVTASNYALRGSLRYQEVEGDAYLEMWNLFADGSRYFSRTLAEAGPLAKITGSSDWREFALPFSLLDSPDRPSLLILSLVLPGKGEVVLGPLRLVQYDSAESMWTALAAGAGAAGAPGAPGWWSPPAGRALSLLGTMILVLASGLAFWLARMGKARAWGLSVLWLETIAGAVALMASVFATLAAQPGWVRTPLIVLGALAILLGMLSLRVVPARYTALELRRMQSQNIG